MSMCFVLFEFDLFVDRSELQLCLEDSAVSEFVIIIIIIIIIIFIVIIIIVIIIIYLKFYGSLDIKPAD